MRLYGPGPGEPPPLVSTHDLAGLRAADAADLPVGQVYGALSEEASGLIRYLDIELQEPEKHVLVPIGHTRIDQEAPLPRVRLRAATYDDLLTIPDYQPGGGEVDAAFHERVLEAYGRLFYGEYYYAHPAYDHSSLFVGESPVVSAPEQATEARSSVMELSRLERPSGGVDMRGLTVEDEAGEAVGEVSDLLVDVAAGRPRYAVIELADLGRRTALPLGYLARAADGDRVRAEGLAVGDIRLLPPYEGPPTREEENRLAASLEGLLTGERYFQRPDFRRS